LSFVSDNRDRRKKRRGVVLHLLHARKKKGKRGRNFFIGKGGGELGWPVMVTLEKRGKRGRKSDLFRI